MPGFSVNQIGLGGLLGVLACDLTFDFGGVSDETKILYYTGMRGAQPPMKFGVLVFIALAFVPLVARVGRKHWADVWSLLLSAPLFYAFATQLIPAQEAVVGKTPADEGVAAHLEGIAFWHLVLAPCMVLQTVLAALSQRKSSSGYAFSVSQVGQSALAGVLVVDLIFDVGGASDAAKIAYYTGMRTSTLPMQAAVPALVLVAFVPILLRLRKLNPADLLLVALGGGSLFIFGGILVPTQDALVGKAPSDAGVAEGLETVKYWHAVLVPLMLASIVLGVVSQARQPDVKRAKSS